MCRSPNDPRFERCEPVPSLPRGLQLVTLRDTADYIMALPMAEQSQEEWQIAIG